MKGYWEGGRFVIGQTVKTAGSAGVGKLELEVAAAVARGRETGDALKEMRELLHQYPALKNDTPERSWNQANACWEGQSHLLTPLAELYADQQMNNQKNTGENP